MHPVKVQVLSRKRLNNLLYKRKGDPAALAGYVASENTIYIAKEQERAEFMHTLWHELKHVFDTQVEDFVMRAECKNLSEVQADMFAALMSNLLPNLKPMDVLRAKRK